MPHKLTQEQEKAIEREREARRQENSKAYLEAQEKIHRDRNHNQQAIIKRQIAEHEM
jgi:hypothetical protein